ncbi:hypothetical protein BGW41_004077 [Actinomortierella wolfii]|nr:hypothetical protein BGW41_004077 [Actinomortierella wolfii]
MPEQTDVKRKSWWGILQTDRMAPLNSPTKLVDQELPYGEKAKALSRASLDSQSAVALGGNNNNNNNNNNNSNNASSNQTQLDGSSQHTLQRVSSRLDVFKKQGLSKKGSKSKFATIATTTSPWSESAANPHLLYYSNHYSGDDIHASAMVNTINNSSNGLAPSLMAKSGMSELDPHYAFGQVDQQQNDNQYDSRMIFNVVEQQEPDGKVHERDVAYSIRVESATTILLLTRRISDFLDFDEKIKAQFPKARPPLPLLDDRKKSFLVTTRQFFFPRKNTAEKLEGYLRKVASHPPICQSKIFQEFLAVSEEGDLMHAKDTKMKPPLRDSLLEPSSLGTPPSMEDVEVADDMSMQFYGGNSQQPQPQPQQQQQQHLYSYSNEGSSYQSQMPPLPPPPQQQHHDYQQHFQQQQQRMMASSQLPPLPPSGQSYYPAHQQQAVMADSQGIPRGRGGKVRPAIPAQLQQQQPSSQQERPPERKVGPKDFDLLKVLGRGCMGKVMLVRERQSKKLYALKAISKEWVILQREIEHTKSERNILANVAKISHPFLIKLRYSFQDRAQLFMVLDYYPGGDIATQLAKWHKFTPPRCLFYTVEIVLGIEELHRLGIVYRDLKPENILLAMDGHIVLTDFGLSKQFVSPLNGNNNGYVENEKTSTFCGTAEYLAPEILLAQEYSYEVDWWSLGTLLYEMLLGITPFWADNHAIMYRRVLDDELEFPLGVEPAAIDFISRLLERDPVRRLGYGSNGARAVKRHPYFKGIDWHQALQRRLPCPYVPELTSEEDLSNFDDTFLTMTPRLSPGNHTLSNSIQNCFQGYSYTMASSALPSGGGTLPRTDSKMQASSATGGVASVQSSYKDHMMNHGPTPHQGSYRGGLHGQNGTNGAAGMYQPRQQQQQQQQHRPIGATTDTKLQHSSVLSSSDSESHPFTDVDMSDDNHDLVMPAGLDGDMEDDDEDYSYENGQPDVDRVHEDLFGYRLDENSMDVFEYHEQYNQNHPYDMAMVSADHSSVQPTQPQAAPQLATAAGGVTRYGSSHRNNSNGSSSGYIPPSAAIAGAETKGQATVDMHVRRSSSANSTSAASALMSCSPTVARHSMYLTGLSIVSGGEPPSSSGGDTASCATMPGSPTTPTTVMSSHHGGGGGAMSSPSASSIKAFGSPPYSPSLPSVPDETCQAAAANGRVIALAETTSSAGGASAAADILRGYSEATTGNSAGLRHNSTSSSRSSDTIGHRLSRSFL